MALSKNVVKKMLHLLTGNADAREVVDAVNAGKAAADQSGSTVAKVILATNVSQTIDFSSLAVGDKVIHVLQGAGGSVNFLTVATKGTLPVAAVVGDLYIAFRAFVAPAKSTDVL